LLPDIVGPAAARLADAAAHRKQGDDAAVAHVHVVPMVEPGTEDDHRAAVGLLCIGGEFARDLDDRGARYAADLFRPGRRERYVLVVAGGDIPAAETAVDAVVRQEEVEDGGHDRLAARQLDLLRRNVSYQDLVVVGGGESVGRDPPEIGKGDRLD